MKTIVGLFERHGDADYAIRELQRQGIGTEQIGVLAREQAVQDYLSDAPPDPMAEIGSAGAAGGAAIGGLGGLLVGVGVLTIPSFGPILAGGTLLAQLVAAVAGTVGGAWLGTVTGGLVGSLVGALIGWGLSEEEAHVYAEGIKRGGILVAVQTRKEDVPLVQSVLRDANAVDINVYREQLKSSGWNSSG